MCVLVENLTWLICRDEGKYELAQSPGLNICTKSVCWRGKENKRDTEQ